MKIRIEQIKDGEEELILRYREKTREIDEILSYLNKRSKAILCKKDGEDVLVSPNDVIYLESVDGTTYAYTENEVFQAGLSLAGAEAEFSGAGFFRCSKSMVINVYHVERLKSEAGNRIDAMMTGGEHVIISRRYAKALRKLLRGNE